MQQRNFWQTYLAVAICTVYFLGGHSPLKGIATAQAWQPLFHDIALPQRIVAVDKESQKFYLYEKQSPMALSLTYPCTTGMVEGDKQIENDKRTPEGVYFVDYKIASGLDFKEYGGIAYTLNYPNPVDKLRGKTGYGIWIHSKGDPIEPRITRGCVAIDLEHIAEVGPKLTPGTAVMIGKSLSTENIIQKDSKIAKHLRMRMEQWTRAWANRSQEFFSFYDTKAYSKAMPETFDAFKQNKERWFKRLKWINIFNREVHVLQGPGYWVTWADQFYRAPNLSTEGIRRLYWQQDSDNEFRIVGMEWIPRNVGMQVAYEKGQLVASTTTKASTDAMPEGITEAPTAPPVYMPETGEKELIQLAENTPKKSAEQHATKNTQGINDPIVITEELRNFLKDKSTAWVHALQKKDTQSFYALYDAKLYDILQLNQGSFKDLQKALQPYFAADWLDIMQGKMIVELGGNIIKTTQSQLIYIAGEKPLEGRQVLYWQKTADNMWHIVGSAWSEQNMGMQVAYLEKISHTISQTIEQWRKDWLSANVDNYMQHYSNTTNQGGKNKQAIAAQKERLWSKAAPVKVELRGLRVQIDTQGVRADMTQVYEDQNGKGDKGIKTLLLQPIHGQWKITKEDWAPLKPTNP